MRNQNQTEKIVEKCNIGTLAHKYMSVHFSGLVQALQKKWRGLNIDRTKTSTLSEMMRCKCFQHVSKIPTYTGTNIKWRG
jgi:hypothetical protein